MSALGPSVPTSWRVFAWAGGVLFVLTLAAGAWWFVVVLGGVPAPGPPPPGVLLWNTALFVVFAVHHSVMARSGAKRWLARHLPPRLERATYVWVASLLFLLMCLAWRPVAGTAWQVTHPALAWAARAVQAAGLLVTLLAARFLDALDLAGVREATGSERNASGVPPAGMDAITARGPYGLVRHPIYLGWVLMVFAAPDMTNGRLLFAIVSTAYVAVAIPWEERSLVAQFGDQFRRYQRQVRWRLIPGIY